MPKRSSQSPRSRIVFGLLFVAAGVMPILSGMGVISVKPTPGTPAPPWLLICVGLSFALAGVAIVTDAVAGHHRRGRTPRVQLIQYLLGLAVGSLLTAPFFWIAFGPGERRFSSTLYIPFLAYREAGSEITGRIAFGACAVMMSAVVIALALSGARRLRRSRLEVREPADDR